MRAKILLPVFIIIVMFLLSASLVQSVDNRFFANQTFDDATWCSESNWTINTCDCDEGVLDCDETEIAGYNNAIPNASIDTNVTCEMKIKQNQANSGGLYLANFEPTPGSHTAGSEGLWLRPDVTVRGINTGGGGIQEITLNIPPTMPFAQLNYKVTFFSNGSIRILINGTEQGILNQPDTRQSVNYFKSQADLTRNEDTEIDDWVCYNGTFYDVSGPVADPCVDINGLYSPSFSDNCQITTTIQAGSVVCEISGDAGTYAIKSGGDLQCDEFHLNPDDFDGDAIFTIEKGAIFRIN